MSEPTESEYRRPKFKMNTETVYRIIVTGLLLLNLWMKTQYVGIDAYERDQNKTRSELKLLSDTLIEMKNQRDTNDRFQAAISDHESRLRVVEKIVR